MQSVERAKGSLTIGALARRAGVGVETVRFYERRGLVPRPPRPRSGYRAYPEETIGRIRFIRHAQALGFTLQETAALLALRLTAGSSCTAVRSRAAIKLADVKARIASLANIRDALEKLVATCPGRGDLSTCTILEALEGSAPQLPELAPLIARRRKTKGASTMKSVALTIAGMHCEGCASTIQTVLAHEPGVKSASVTFSNGTATVLYDPAATNPSRLTGAVERAGFRAATMAATPGSG